MNSQGSGATGIATGSTVVNITPVNDPPTLSATTTAATYTEDAAAVSLFSGANASTVEAGQNRLAVDSVMMVTGAAVRISVPVKLRPRTIGIPIVWKKPGLTRFVLIAPVSPGACT